VIWLEAVAAALVGVALLLVVLGPLISREAIPAIVDDEPGDLEETPKGIALSALKEIEFDQATGKLSDEDYAMLKGKYTAQALQALRAEDAPPGPAAPVPGAARGHHDLEAVIAARARAIRSEGSASHTCPHCGPRPEQDALFCSSCGAGLGERQCGQCASTLPPGSRFCDRCGTRVAA
jgi:hypothetical protein